MRALASDRYPPIPVIRIIRCDPALQSPLPRSSRQPIDLAHLVTGLRELSDRVGEVILCDVGRMASLSHVPDIAFFRLNGLQEISPIAV